MTGILLSPSLKEVSAKACGGYSIPCVPVCSEPAESEANSWLGVSRKRGLEKIDLSKSMSRRVEPAESGAGEDLDPSGRFACSSPLGRTSALPPVNPEQRLLVFLFHPNMPDMRGVEVL